MADWNPGPKYQAYLDRIQDLLSNEERTVRNVYYALEARGFPKELAEQGYDFSYRNVKRAVKKGRRASYINPALIVDESRRPEETANAYYQDPAHFVRRHVEGVQSDYDENVWDEIGTHVEVWLEKAALASLYRPIIADYNVRLEATSGDWSDSKVYEACQRIIGAMKDGKDVRILYHGDYNPSGLHAPVAIQQTMNHYGVEFRPQDEPDGRYFEIWPYGDQGVLLPSAGTRLSFERVALNLEHIERYDLPENPTPSSTDKDQTLRERFMEHASNGRDVNIELNALSEYHPDDLEVMIRDSIEQHRDEEAVSEVGDRVEQRREKIGAAISVDWDELS